MSSTAENSNYKAPMVEVIKMAVTEILCQSNGNEFIYEEDLGDGGFH